jgi:hypothetical protein
VQRIAMILTVLASGDINIPSLLLLDCYKSGATSLRSTPASGVTTVLVSAKRPQKEKPMGLAGLQEIDTKSFVFSWSQHVPDRHAMSVRVCL